MSIYPPLNTLRCFEASVRHRSFSRAAGELHVTQSAVSHQIRHLEDWVGAPLFVRQGRDMVPTERGEELARPLGEAFELIQDACRRAKSGSQPLTVAVPPSITTIWLIPRLDRFYAAHPNMPVKIAYLIPGQRLDFQDIDFAIMWESAKLVIGQPGLQAVRLFAGDTVAVANPAVRDKLGPLETVQHLLDASLLHDTDRRGWQRYLRRAGLKQAAPRPGPVFADFNMLRAATLAGQGVSLCPRTMIEDDVQAGRLVILFDDIVINQDMGYWLIESAGRADSRSGPGAAFRNWLVAEAGRS